MKLENRIAKDYEDTDIDDLQKELVEQLREGQGVPSHEEIRQRILENPKISDDDTFDGVEYTVREAVQRTIMKRKSFYSASRYYGKRAEILQAAAAHFSTKFGIYLRPSRIEDAWKEYRREFINDIQSIEKN
ncbi:hypothetical protein J7481_12845 [Labrenzia sp. R4_2]|uniref:hypothetical protein n=1 Tax=Labrenzia sp. R4_2 TaxID=2821107 RepID=UPI001AD9CB3C|nr:hypothetical protein [Labrenzia sp. R4_2]MBO9420383.1 hypothetical protein [Labrenzia sp. R4_2]